MDKSSVFLFGAYMKHRSNYYSGIFQYHLSDQKGFEKLFKSIQRVQKVSQIKNSLSTLISNAK